MVGEAPSVIYLMVEEEKSWLPTRTTNNIVIKTQVTASRLLSLYL
jgi:hypothetical protein